MIVERPDPSPRFFAHARGFGAIVLALAAPAAASAQLVEDFVVAAGPRFWEQPWITGNMVLWKRYGASRQGSDAIECADISRLGQEVVPIVIDDSNRILLLAGGHLYRYVEGGEGILARALPSCGAPQGEDLVVTEFSATLRAANSEYVFLEHENTIYAKAVRDFGDSSRETLRAVARIVTSALIIRAAAASSEYFVWQDHEVGEPARLFARRMEALFEEGDDVVVETRLRGPPAGTLYLDLEGHHVVFVGAESPDLGAEVGIYIVDLESPGERLRVFVSPEAELVPIWPAISGDYVVWTEMRRFFTRHAFARALEDGRPVGDPIPLGSGGSWITIDGNIAVANGATRFGEGDVRHDAIVAWELDLPSLRGVGDADGNGSLEISDAVAVLNYLFLGGWRPRLRLADWDRNRRIEMVDALKLLNHLFAGGPGPAGR
jgi:hypothetical protein